MLQMQKGLDGCIIPLNVSCMFNGLGQKSIMLKIFLGFITVFTAVLNLLVMISIIHFRQLHTPTNLLILSLAVSDFLVGIITMPISLVETFTCWVKGQQVCVFIILLGFIFTSASVGNMLLISVDRYVAICDPLHYSSMITTVRVIISLSVCWIMSVLYSVVMLKENFIFTHNYCYHECTLISSFMLGSIDLVVTFFAPVTVIIILYMRVFVVAVSQARAMHSGKSDTVRVKKSELRAARTLGIVLFVFLLCLCPFYCITLSGQDILGFNRMFESWLFYVNSSFNPLIYAIFYRWFRKAVKLIVTIQILQPGSRDINIMQR